MLRKKSFKSDKYIITSLIEVEYELIYVKILLSTVTANRFKA